MKHEAKERARIRDAIERKPLPTIPLHPEVRVAAVDYTKRRLLAGATQIIVASELGVSENTVRKWAHTEIVPAATPTLKMRPVQIRDERLAAPGALAIVTPRAYGLDGLDVDTAVLLLERLG